MSAVCNATLSSDGAKAAGSSNSIQTSSKYDNGKFIVTIDCQSFDKDKFQVTIKDESLQIAAESARAVGDAQVTDSFMFSLAVPTDVDQKSMKYQTTQEHALEVTFDVVKK